MWRFHEGKTGAAPRAGRSGRANRRGVAVAGRPTRTRHSGRANRRGLSVAGRPTRTRRRVSLLFASTNYSVERFSSVVVSFSPGGVALGAEDAVSVGAFGRLVNEDRDSPSLNNP